jgi:hypothetical protein
MSTTDKIDTMVDKVFGKYCVDKPEIKMVSKKRKYGVVITETNELALLYSDTTRTRKGVTYYPVERRNLGGTGTTLKWMDKRGFKLL